MGSVALRQIQKHYGDTPVIHGVDLDVRDGEFMVFVGPSGCGKSTMLRMIAGLEEISGGDLAIAGERVNELAPAARGTAMVFQNYALYPHMTVAENMGFGLKIAGTPKAEVQQAVRRAADILRIGHLLERRPKALSGGERQRVAIGRAIVRKPKVFLFDEPLSNLDAALRVQMRLELSRLHQELGTTMIYVTHDQVEAMTMGDRIAVFHQGRIEQVGQPLELYRQPANQFVAGFLGSPKMNFIRCSAMVDVATGGIRLQFAGGFHAPLPGAGVEPGDYLLGIRPEHLAVALPGHGLPAQLQLIEHLGDSAVAYLRVSGSEALVAIRVEADRAAGLQAGKQIALQPELRHAVLFGADGKAAQR
jgi:multiple sugar transport system ATP-binding protein